jgi:hypothetical protein
LIVDWDTFEQDLALALPLLAERVRLTICWSTVPPVYVQIYSAPDRLWLRTGAGDVVGFQAGSTDAEESQLDVRGWDPPATEPSGSHAWWTSLKFPAWSTDYERVASMLVGVLRDVRGVPAPTELEYRAEREAEAPPLDEDFYEENLEPAVPHLVFRQLGIRDANAA